MNNREPDHQPRPVRDHSRFMMEDAELLPNDHVPEIPIEHFTDEFNRGEAPQHRYQGGADVDHQSQ